MIVACLMACLLDIRVPLVLRSFCFPPARPGRSRLVTGRSRRDGPYAVTAGHVQSRPVTSLRVGSRLSRRRVAWPAARASTARSLTLDLRDQSCVRSVRHESPRLLESLCAAPARSRRCSRDFDATLRSRRQTKMSQGPRSQRPAAGQLCHADTGSQAIGQ